MPVYRSAGKNFYLLWHQGRWSETILFFAAPFLQDIQFLWLGISDPPWSTMVKLFISTVIVGIMTLPVFLLLATLVFTVGLVTQQLEQLFPNALPCELQMFCLLKRTFQIRSTRGYSSWCTFYDTVLTLISIVDHINILRYFT